MHDFAFWSAASAATAQRRVAAHSGRRLARGALWLALAAAVTAPARSEPAAALPAERALALVQGLSLQEKIAQLQDAAPAVPRLGLPAYAWWNEGLHGLARTGHATVFPQAIGLAASWDTSLLHQVGGVIAAEARDKYALAQQTTAQPGSLNTARYRGLTIWSPNINIFRDPRWGRGQETYGEDPRLTAQLGVAFVRGLQGDDPAHPTVIATPKHLAVHSGPERGRHAFNVDPSPYDLEDTYLPAFRATVTDGQVGSVMCAYNAIGGTPACANAGLLQDRLRGDWGFQGFVVTDCDAVEDMALFHKSAPDDAEASARSLLAGTDLNCGRTYKALGEAVRRGRVTEADIDRALGRLLVARGRLGTLDAASPKPQTQADPAGRTAGARRWLALQAARESMVLLKNDHHTLPLKAGARLAVVGPTADLLEDLEANYHGTARDPVTPLAGMRQHFGAGRIAYAQGATLAAQIPVAVPRTALRTPDGKPGLRMEVFADASFDGRPAAVRSEPTVNMDYDRVAPAPGVSPTRFAIRWTGQLVLPGPGTYTLGVKTDRCFDCAGHDLVRLYVDGKPLVDSRKDAPLATLTVTDRRPHTLRLELVHDGEDQGITLLWQAPADVQRAEAVAAARSADAVVAFVGLSPNLEGEQLEVEVPGFDGGDRSALDLPAAQQALLEAVKATGKPLIVVLQSGSAVALNWAAEHADAVLAAWYPGEAGGQAIAETLAGDNNPAGRLPVTFYRNAADLPDFSNYGMAGRTYRYFDGKPLWPFGHGLSYTRFGYGTPSLSATRLAAGAPLTVSVDVRNEGPRDGDEVVQLYLEPPRTTPAERIRPRHKLVAFQRVHLRAGEQRRLTLALDARALSVVDAQGARAVEAGAYAVTVGGGQPGFATVQRSSFTIDGRAPLPR